MVQVMMVAEVATLAAVVRGVVGSALQLIIHPEMREAAVLVLVLVLVAIVPDRPPLRLTMIPSAPQSLQPAWHSSTRCSLALLVPPSTPPPPRPPNHAGS